MTGGWTEALRALMQSRWFDPARLFLIIAIPLSAFYIWQIAALSHFPHNKGRFLNAVHLVLALTGEGDRMPASFFDVLGQIGPFGNEALSDKPCHMQYCRDFPKGYQNPSFSELAAIALKPAETLPFSPHMYAAQFPFIGYVFYALGAAIGLALQLPPIIILYLSIGVNAAAALALNYYALRLLPAMRWPVFYLLLLPCSFLFRVQVTPDALTQALCLLALAIASRLAYRPRMLAQLQSTGLIVLAFIIGFIKLAYIFVPAVFAVIPASCFKTPLRKWAVVTSALLLSIAGGVGWGLYATATLYPWEMLPHAPGVASKFMQHVSEVALQPFAYLAAIFEAMMKPHKLYPIAANMITGRWYWWHWLPDGPKSFLPLLPLLLLAVPGERDGLRPLLWTRLLGLGIFFATWITLCIIMHFHRPGTPEYTVWLVQGRYLLIAMPFLVPAFDALIRLPAAMQLWLRFAAIELALGYLLWLNLMQFVISSCAVGAC